MFPTYKKFLKENWPIVLVAVFIGLVYVLPHLLFIVSLGGEYQGIPNFQTPNEISYLARIREVLDGHMLVSSPFLFEYKDQFPFTPPTSEYVYAIPSFILAVSPENILIASKFVLPFILFLLIYTLIYKLTENYGSNFSRKFTAVSGSLLILLGYDLIDFRTVLRFISGETSPGGFLLWARPVNPIMGAIFLFSFLLFIWAIVKNTKFIKSSIVGAGVFLALMIGSYFFSWGIAVSALSVFVLIYFLKKEYLLAGRLAVIFPAALIFSAPYWYVVWQAGKSSWYSSSILRSGIFYTHWPLLNKLVITALVGYIVIFLIARLKNREYIFSDWHWFSSALLLGSLWAYSQQIVTGQTVWPYHFVQYSIPFVMIVFMVVLYNVIKKWLSAVWITAIFIIITASLSYGIYVQASAYNNSFAYYANMQSYRPVFDWLNQQEKDCVVLVNENSSEASELNTMIPAFTRCNRYATTEVMSLMPDERVFHGYLALLRLKGIGADEIYDYLLENRTEAKGYLYSNWSGLFGVNDFPDFSDEILEKRMKEFPNIYSDFLKKDFRRELEKYKIDYILSVGAMPEMNEVFSANNLYLYDLSYMR